MIPNILVVGSGGREHVLVWKIHQSPLVKKIYAAPGNAGIAQLAECVEVNAEDIDSLRRFAAEQKIDLTVVGPEVPLVNGIVDSFEAAGLRIFGPTKAAAQLEGSKAFAKDLMARLGVPTASYETFDRVDQAKHFMVQKKPPFVIKADGLAAGKGVLITNTHKEAVDVVRQIIEKRRFGNSGKRVVIEEHLTGDELSVLLFTDGSSILPLASSQDHKRAYDGDRGPNTGGMGAYCPCPFVSNEELNRIVETTARPVIQELNRRGTPYRGLLYLGLMMTPSGPYVLEYNVRFGDPEAQAVLPRLKTDIVPLMLEVADGALKTKALEWDTRACIAVVMASAGYPGPFEKGHEIEGLDKVNANGVFVFHAGTRKGSSGKVVTDGGRVLAVSALGESLREAHERAYRSIKEIAVSGGFYRSDIGKRVLENMKVG
ncbi:MAG: phosphoribosylamine--glycine ligase [Omnitrophica bacterium RIFCSPLOWO2_12_FULL_50_11]|nr:MAG: phosphoribosylamine--glycine ligase [Omnitrophica bacterium RIFCSPLOWO2_12_FULL_50_11]